MNTQERKTGAELYDTPMAEYIFSPRKISLENLAKKWKNQGFTRNSISKLAFHQGWKAKRGYYQKIIYKEVAKRLLARVYKWCEG